MYVCMILSLCINIPIHVYKHMYNTYKCILYMHVYAEVLQCFRVCVCMCVHVFMYVYLYMYIKHICNTSIVHLHPGDSSAIKIF